MRTAARDESAGSGEFHDARSAMTEQLPEHIGKYQILERIGSGGMGHVYLGRDPESGAEAAVKVLTPGLARESGFVERFNREIEAMQKLTHPSIVRLFDHGVDGESYYFAMEFIQGETLLAFVRRVRRVPWRRAFEIAEEICGALKTAHDHGIIHRDLKPSNLLLDSQGRVRLTDFGVAQVFDTQRLTITGGVIGTAEYMSPEQAEGKRASRQSDLYSLGVVLYTMVTGRTPFTGSTAIEVMQKHRFGLFDRPSAVVPELPRRVDETICRLLEKDPGKRFPDAFVLQRHLRHVQQIEDRVAQGATIAENSSVDSAATTSVAPSDKEPEVVPVRRAGQATLAKSLLRRHFEEDADQSALVSWLASLPGLLASLAAVVLLAWWLWPREPTPQQLFDRGIALMGQGAGLNYLQARKEYFLPLLDRERDGWQERVSPYLQEIELYELDRSARRGRIEPADSSSQDEPRRLLRHALALRQSGNPAQAARMLASLDRLLSADPSRSDLRPIVGRALDEMNANQQLASARDYANEMLARVDEHISAGQHAEASALCLALRDLYGDDSAIRAKIEETERRLQPNSEAESAQPAVRNE